MADAYIVDSTFECELISDDELSWYLAERVTEADPIRSITPLELVCSFDHGLRSADELCGDIAATIGDLIAARVFILLGMDVSSVDCFGAAAEEFHLERDEVSGIWNTPDEELDASQILFEAIDYELVPMLQGCGYIFEQSGDAGMTWIYRPIEEHERQDA